MPQNSSSNPSPLEPARAGANGQRTPIDASYETDFADLAARFSAKSGGGLSPELSADLALEVVLNEIVEQACMATGATGAAIVLARDGEFACRATSGANAPELGSRLDTNRGLSGECVRTRETQRSGDVLSDARADLEASRHLGVRSVIVMPLLEAAELVGVFELFSSRPSAFGERDEGTLEILAGRVLSNLERAAQPLTLPASLALAKPWPRGSAVETHAHVQPKDQPPQKPPQKEKNVAPLAALLANHSAAVPSDRRVSTPTPPNTAVASPLPANPVSDPVPANPVVANSAPASSMPSSVPPASTTVTEMTAKIGTAETETSEDADSTEDASQSEPAAREDHFGFMNLVLSAAVLLCAILLGVLVGRHLSLTKPAARRHVVVPAATAVDSAPASDTNAATGNDQAATQPAPAAKSARPAVPPGGLLIFENGKEVFHAVPGETVSAATASGETAGAANSSLGPVPPAASIEADQRPTNAAGVANLPPDAADDALLRRVEPEYPEQARAQKIQGPVVLEVRARRDGSVQDVKLLSGQPLLAGAAIAAVRQWQFKPQVVEGKPVAIETRVTLNFRLPQ